MGLREVSLDAGFDLVIDSLKIMLTVASTSIVNIVSPVFSQTKSFHESLNEKRNLSVRELKPNSKDYLLRWETAHKTAAAWGEIAKSKQTWFFKDTQFNALERMAIQLGVWTEIPQAEKRLFICETKGVDELQAIALAEKKKDGEGDFLFLQFIVTNPENIRTKSQHPRVRGAGTALMTEMVRKCLEEGNRSFRLYAEDSSILFYEKLGFRLESSQSKLMILEHAQFKKFLETHS